FPTRLSSDLAALANSIGLRPTPTSERDIRYGSTGIHIAYLHRCISRGIGAADRKFLPCTDCHRTIGITLTRSQFSLGQRHSIPVRRQQIVNVTCHLATRSSCSIRREDILCAHVVRHLAAHRGRFVHHENVLFARNGHLLLRFSRKCRNSETANGHYTRHCNTIQFFYFHKTCSFLSLP